MITIHRYDVVIRQGGATKDIHSQWHSSNAACMVAVDRELKAKGYEIRELTMFNQVCAVEVG